MKVRKVINSTVRIVVGCAVSSHRQDLIFPVSMVYTPRDEVMDREAYGRGTDDLGKGF